ncbi:YlbF family regulator [Pseudalkalibacillus salsuginis]|uniref:YlbF family regulator n=1 Tax=Pseudalkalibacillus salsuginis TaxID=2910972 RepID=UPI001F1CC2B6|nr:YlbF family regulator [Pseudalkalibacillus salsuginis]MCF6410442.1 YlbF family regulator [Pseudalkalibacillus salsuginis]
MLATVEGIEILDGADELASVIVNSDIGQEYKEAKKKLREDKEAQKLIDEFSKMKEKYEEVQRFGKYHPDYKTVSTDIRVLKREIDLNETVAAFKRAEKELEGLLNEICGVLAGQVSKNIKVPTGNPFFDNMSCGGGCGSGGACGCG